MLVAVLATPFWIGAGNPHPMGPFHEKCLEISLTTFAMALGVDGCGVSILNLSASSVPVVVSTGAPLIPEPPTSIPKMFKIYSNLDFCALA